MSDLPIFPLSNEHKMLRDAARDFAQKEIVPIAAEFDESGEFPTVTIKKMGELGFMGIEVPEQYGGSGIENVLFLIPVGEICKADLTPGVTKAWFSCLLSHRIRRL